MVKLYLSYFTYGLYIFYVTLIYGGFSAGPANVLPYVTLFSSIILFSMASGLSLFYTKAASILGLLCLIGTTMFGIYLIGQITLSSMVISSVIILMSLLYLVSTFHSVSILINYRKPIEESKLKKPIKLVLAFVPIALLAWWVISIFVMR